MMLLGEDRCGLRLVGCCKSALLSLLTGSPAVPLQHRRKATEILRLPQQFQIPDAQPQLEHTFSSTTEVLIGAVKYPSDSKSACQEFQMIALSHLHHPSSGKTEVKAHTPRGPGGGTYVQP